ncbi:hypothetical protein [Fluviicola taffensis]|uniref:Uncharacterized protein n=1 Tax=Fluviicola taffensis (strain DSM 16823 / NCIMB 13979 / RW262) TaxID=755732 RepID=F2IJW8_FLUTR|nr:hypothetical protein [Fluviicola taffensis]AEA45027.1 hypothetical protein Fluta_3051 [Fluviicola taffensis DSM 16823]
MNSFAVEVWDDEGSKCTLYTVKQLDASYSETDKFFLKSRNNDTLKRNFQEIAKFLTTIIGEVDGALSIYFREERSANGIPPKGEIEKDTITFFHINYPLRLYCLRISNEIVVLFNGDEKTSDAAQDGKTSMVFYEAQQFAVKILKAYNYGEFQFGQTEEIIID